MELADALKLIVQIKDIVPIKLERLFLSLIELQTNAKESLEKMNTKQNELTEALEKVQILLNELPEQVRISELNLNDQIKNVEGEVQKWENYFTDSQEELSREMQQIYEEIDNLKNQIIDRRNQQSAIEKEVGSVLRSLWQTSYKKQELLTVTFTITQQEMYNFRQQIQSNQDLLGDQINFLERELEQKKEETNLIIQDLINDSLVKLKSKLGENIEDINENFNDSSSELLNLMETKIKNDLKNPLEKEMNKYLEKIALLQNLSQIKINQDRIEDGLEKIDCLSPNINELFEQIKQAKISLGINN
jgi:DNA repair exonuclease SbcCD ATPase subunit